MIADGPASPSERASAPQDAAAQDDAAQAQGQGQRAAAAQDAAAQADGQSETMFDRVGGREWFVALVDRFYDRVADDPVLRPLYPEDLGPPRHHLSSFLIQYWGGPSDYNEERGHPRLRMRHQPFVIGNAERLAWYRAMTASVREGGLSAADEEEMTSYFASTATSLMNTGRSDLGTPVSMS